eukprot:scaffold271_cov336-Pavlova_lutheri.AAC.37
MKPSRRRRKDEPHCVPPPPPPRNRSSRRKTPPSEETPEKPCRTLETSSASPSTRWAKITRPTRTRIKKKVPSRPRASTERRDGKGNHRPPRDGEGGGKAPGAHAPVESRNDAIAVHSARIEQRPRAAGGYRSR